MNKKEIIKEYLINKLNKVKIKDEQFSLKNYYVN